MPDIREFWQRADLISAPGYQGAGDLMYTPASERAPFYKILSAGRAGWAGLMRKMLSAKAPPAEVESKVVASRKEVDKFVATERKGLLAALAISCDLAKKPSASLLKLCVRAARPFLPVYPSSIPSSGTLPGLPKTQLAKELQMLRRRASVVRGRRRNCMRSGEIWRPWKFAREFSSSAGAVCGPKR